MILRRQGAKNSRIALIAKQAGFFKNDRIYPIGWIKTREGTTGLL
jgi:hypothetical protein